MARREIIVIDEAKCTGCGECATGCPEGALRIIDGKARLVGESLCDGLGACIGTCPEGAILITEREAEPYDEAKVMEGMVKLGPKVLAAHLEHLSHHGQDRYVREALAWLEARGLTLPEEAKPEATPRFEACPGSAARAFKPAAAAGAAAARTAAPASPSALSGWPIQLHLVNPRAPQFAGTDLLVAADCTAFALGSFHAGLLEGRSLVIACPKLDVGREIYLDKLAVILDVARSVKVAIMEVPCCSGLLKLVLEAREAASSKARVEVAVVGIQGDILRESSH
jgi:NAD-dependent dihydropyrimidine dehydrogenase PreA subunit